MIEINNIQIAPTHIMLDVLLGDDIESINERIDTKYDYEFDDTHYGNFIEAMRERQGFCHQVMRDDGIPRLLIWVRDKDDLITISHEVIHATWWIQHYSGFKFSYDSQEIQTFLHDYVMYEILKQC